MKQRHFWQNNMVRIMCGNYDFGIRKWDYKVDYTLFANTFLKKNALYKLENQLYWTVPRMTVLY